VLLPHFWLGLSKESALQLDIIAKGSFTHKSTDEREALLDQILENTPPLEPIRVEPLLRHEEASSVEAELSLPKEELLPEPENPKEDPEPIDLSPFDDDLFEDFGNTSNYLCQKKPPTPNPPSDLLDKEFLRKSIKELSAILSIEWLEETEQSMEEIVILTPPSTIQCKVRGKWVDVLYNPMVGSNLMSTSFASDFLDEKPHVLTTKSLRISP
jgi:DNA helicase HerA-like ATPase